VLAVLVLVVRGVTVGAVAQAASRTLIETTAPKAM